MVADYLHVKGERLFDLISPLFYSDWIVALVKEVWIFQAPSVYTQYIPTVSCHTLCSAIHHLSCLSGFLRTLYHIRNSNSQV